MPKKIFLNHLDITRAYLIYDTVIMNIYSDYIFHYRLMLIHHLIFLFGMSTSLIEIYPHYTAQALMAEVTNIPLYVGWVMLKKGYQRSKILLINGIIVLVLFFKYRVYNFTKLFYISLAIENGKVGTGVIFIIMMLNIYWFVKLFEKVFYLFN